MISIRTLWRSLASPRVSESELARLHNEIARLRAENRALLNSILGIAGMKPLPPAPLPSFTTQPASAGHSESSTPPRAADRPLSTATSSGLPTAVASEPPLRQSETRNDSSTPVLSSRARAAVGPDEGSAVSPSAPRMIHTPPHRRRSWHQINRLLEFQSARKDPERVL